MCWAAYKALVTTLLLSICAGLGRCCCCYSCCPAGQSRAQADEFALLPPLRGGDLGWEYVGRKGNARNTFGPGSNSALIGDYRWASGRTCVWKGEGGGVANPPGQQSGVMCDHSMVCLAGHRTRIRRASMHMCLLFISVSPALLMRWLPCCCCVVRPPEPIVKPQPAAQPAPAAKAPAAAAKPKEKAAAVSGEDISNKWVTRVLLLLQGWVAVWLSSLLVVPHARRQ